jgi:hypothetical protein
MIAALSAGSCMGTLQPGQTILGSDMRVRGGMRPEVAVGIAVYIGIVVLESSPTVVFEPADCLPGARIAVRGMVEDKLSKKPSFCTECDKRSLRHVICLLRSRLFHCIDGRRR